MDIRERAAAYYDLNPQGPDDLEFYRSRVPAPPGSILELGCGTGRLLLPLAENGAHIHGVDISPAMLAICKRRLASSERRNAHASVEVGDITKLELGRTFERVWAPFRVLQSLDTNSEVDGFFETIRRHLAPGGSAIVSAFMPNRDAENMRQGWLSEREVVCWQVEVDGQRVTCHSKNARIDAERLVLYPDLIYRRYDDAEEIDRSVHHLVMRCYYPEELEQLVRRYGFAISGMWGGYRDEAFGEGQELVIEFEHGSDQEG